MRHASGVAPRASRRRASACGNGQGMGEATEHLVIYRVREGGRNVKWACAARAFAPPPTCRSPGWVRSVEKCRYLAHNRVAAPRSAASVHGVGYEGDCVVAAVATTQSKRHLQARTRCRMG
eukprot:3613028-Prymnesium_polylepis.1